MSLSFDNYYARFNATALKHGMTILQLSHGGCIATLGEAPYFALMSGLHGDERSGPLAILEWLENTPPQYLISSHHGLWIAPLINDNGWNKNSRLWNDIDLNRCFTNEAPAFLNIIMQNLTDHPPTLFLDLHEDSACDQAYVFQCREDTHELASALAMELNADIELWSHDDEWVGASETFVRHLGVNKSITIEAPPIWSIEDRIAWQKRAILWCCSHMDF